MSKKKSKVFPLLEYIKKRDNDAQQVVRLYAALEEHIKELRKMREAGAGETLSRCRAGSVLEDTVQLFWDKTDLPLALPYWFTLGTLGGIITQRGVQIQYGEQVIDPNLWVLLLAESGMGKTWTLERIKKLAGDGSVIINQAGYRTKPAMVADLERYPEMAKSVLCIDEMAQTIKLFRKETGADLKEALLMSYDGHLEHTTKKDGRVQIDNIALTILAATVLSTFTRTVTAEDMMDGFLQRFLLVKAHGERNMKNWPYEIQGEDTTRIQRKFRDWEQRISGLREFHLTPPARDLWVTWYQRHFPEDLESYYKRYLWATLKLSAIYHTLGPEISGRINTDDMGYAIRALDTALESLYDIMDRSMNFSATEQQTQLVRAHIERYPDRSSRDILRSMKISKGELIMTLKILRDRGQVTEGVYHRLVK